MTPAPPPPPLAPLPPERLRGLQALLSRAVLEGVTPGASLWLARRHEGAWRGAQLTEGRLSRDPGAAFVSADTHYDLASLTKPLAVGAWLWELLAAGALTPQTTIGEALRGAARLEDPLLSSAPVWRLANHSAGLPAHRRYHEGLAHGRLSGEDPRALKGWARRVIARTPCEYAPGSKSVYSDLGYLLLEWALERLSGETLEGRWAGAGAGLHFRPLAPRGAPPPPAPVPASACAPTERCPWRGPLQGEVHDDNAWLFGGVCGHAGLFGRAADVGGWGAWLLDALAARAAPALTAAVRDALDLRWRAPERGSFVLGMDTPSPGYSSAGGGFGRWAVGHLGFTGTSLWVDVEREVVVVLLTNRVHPSRARGLEGVRWLRPAVHDEVWRVVG